MEPTLEQVVSWVKEAASMARQMRQEDLQIRHKSKADLVTEADTAIEAFLIDKIHTNFPNHSIKAEESGQHDGDQEDQRSTRQMMAPQSAPATGHGWSAANETRGSTQA